MVNLFANVRNKNGQIVKDLTKDDFLLDEDGRAQAIRYFSQESDLPLTLGLLVDTSGSQRRLIEEERSASYRFFEQVLRPEKDVAFVIHFDFDVELLQDITSSRKLLEKALENLEAPAQRQQQRQTTATEPVSLSGRWRTPRARRTDGRRRRRPQRRRNHAVRCGPAGVRRTHAQAERPQGADPAYRRRGHRQQSLALLRGGSRATGGHAGVLHPVRRPAKPTAADSEWGGWAAAAA